MLWADSQCRSALEDLVEMGAPHFDGRTLRGFAVDCWLGTGTRSYNKPSSCHDPFGSHISGLVCRVAVFSAKTLGTEPHVYAEDPTNLHVHISSCIFTFP